MMSVGRKTKLTVKRHELILKLLRKGLSHKACYGAAHIDRDTFYDWIRTNPAFSASVQAAEAEAEAKWLEGTEEEQGGKRWLLSRRFRPDYGDKVEVEHSGEQKLIIEVIEVERPSYPPSPTPQATGD